MECNCIEEITDRLREKSGDLKAEISTAMGFTKAHKAIVYVPILCRYREKKLNGEFNKHTTNGTIPANYCPFCGLKIF